MSGGHFDYKQFMFDDIIETIEKNLNDAEYRQFLHTCLDEWLDKSSGTGGFYIKNAKHTIEIK